MNRPTHALTHEGPSTLRRCGRCLLGLAVVMVSAIVVVADPAAAGASATSTPTAYVLTTTSAGAGAIVPLETSTNKKGTPISIPGTDPEAMAITPNGTTAYVAEANGNLVPVDLATGVAGSAIAVGLEPDAVAIAPDGTTAYVVNGQTCECADGTVTPVDLTTGTAGTPITVGYEPVAIAITPDGTRAYVANEVGNSLTPIDLATDTAGAPIAVGSEPLAVAIAPNGTAAFVANELGGTVTSVNVPSDTVSSEVAAGSGPDAIAITPDGEWGYTADSSACLGSACDGTVTPINLSGEPSESAITVGPGPDAVAITPDGSTAYVANFGCYATTCNGTVTGSVTPINLSENTAGAAIKLKRGAMPVAIDMSPPSAGWTTQATLPNATSSAGPGLGLAWFGPFIYAAYKGKSSNAIYYDEYSGAAWTTEGTISGTWGSAETTAAPALVSYGNELYAFWSGQSGDEIWYSAYDGTTWSPQATVSGSWGTALTNRGPTVTVYDGDLYVAWRGASSGRIWYSPYNGSSWTYQSETSFSTPDHPAIAADGTTGGFDFAWTTSADQVDLAYCLGTGPDACGSAVTLSQPLTNEPPALAFMGGGTGTLYLAWKGENTDGVFYTADFDNEGFVPEKSVPAAGTDDGPALAVSNYTLYTAWTGTSKGKVYYSESNTPY